VNDVDACDKWSTPEQTEHVVQVRRSVEAE
jgi:hypothetical protein